MVVKQDYHAEHVAEQMATSHYPGKSKTRAAIIFYRDLEKLVGQLSYEQFTLRITEVNRMADELKAEGWCFLPGTDEDGGGIWYHHRAGSVNSLGRGFPSFEAATVATYNSAVRELHNVAN